jgi:O-methyltransferase
MVPRHRFIDNLRLGTLVRRGVDGDLVECGTWRGGMIAAMSEKLEGRKAVLFDSFEGLPPAEPIDGHRAAQWQAEVEGADYYDNCSATVEEAERAMLLSGARYEIRKGWFEETVPHYAGEEPAISVLRVDADWYAPTILCLRYLFPRVVTDGLVLIDDYAIWEGCTRAVHDYLSEIGSRLPIERTPSGVTFIRVC